MKKRISAIKSSIREEIQGKKEGWFRPVMLLLGAVILYNIFLPVPTFSENSPYTSLKKPAPTYGFPEIEVREDRVIREYWSQVTVYNSLPEQTSGDPFIMATGERVFDGAIAANCLPFNTRLRMPELSGDKVYIVKDRLAADKTCFVIDIWQDHTLNYPSFGSPITKIEILQGSPRMSFAWLNGVGYAK